MKEERRRRAVSPHEYYRKLGVIAEDGMVESRRYVAELTEALDEMGEPLEPGIGQLVEVGCGISPYVEWVKKLGYDYIGTDLDSWALQILWHKYGVRTFKADLNASSDVNAWPVDLPDPEKSVILACHVFEHLDDSPGVIDRMSFMLEPGGRLIGIVPMGIDDLWNPDHKWFYTEETLKLVLESNDRYEDVKTVVKQRIERERFIYFSARRK
jgi:SAM-dependent methyltransferase